MTTPLPTDGVLGLGTLAGTVTAASCWTARSCVPQLMQGSRPAAEYSCQVLRCKATSILFYAVDTSPARGQAVTGAGNVDVVEQRQRLRE